MPRLMRLYAEAFDAELAHSFEVWKTAGKLVAGGYGMAIEGNFCFESQSSKERNASKIGMSVLNWHSAYWGYRFNDEFLARLAEAVNATGHGGRWQVESDLESVSRWLPQA